MKYMVIDTEGTGLFRHKNPDGSVARSDEPGQPRMAEFAAVLCDDNFEIEETYQRYIVPDDTWTVMGDFKLELPMTEMPEEALNVNGLTFEFLHTNGVPVREALEYFSTNIPGRALLGFNQQHDGRQLRGELRRAGMPDLFEETPAVCAMRSMSYNKVKVKKLNGKGGFPRLIDAAAHFQVPGYEEEKRHKALDDALATVFIARRLYSQNLLLAPEVHRNASLEDKS